MHRLKKKLTSYKSAPHHKVAPELKFTGGASLSGYRVLSREMALEFKSTSNMTVDSNINAIRKFYSRARKIGNYNREDLGGSENS